MHSCAGAESVAAPDEGAESVAAPDEGADAGFIFIALLNMVAAEYPMINAAATIMAQSGEIVASHTPSIDVMAPPKPAARPNFGMHVPLRRCEIAPEALVGIMVNSEVAVLAIGSNI